MSSAGVSDASTQPFSSRPRHSGRNPLGSRTPITRSASMNTKRERALEAGQHRGDRPLERVARRPRRRPARISAATSSATRSVSLLTVPGSIPASSASASVLVRLPLWPRAKPLSPVPRNTGWALRQVLEPVVE